MAGVDRPPPPCGYAWRTILWTATSTLLAVAVALAMIEVLLQGDLVAALRDPTYDPIQSGDLPVEAGWLSHAGALALWSAAVASGFAASLTRVGDDRTLLLSGGLISACLALDDLFMIHDLLVPRYSPLPEASVLGIWALLVALWLLHFRRREQVQEYSPLLWLAGGLFAVSIIIDTVFDGRETASAYIAEDVAKLLGITLWAAFHILLAKSLVARLDDRAEARPPPSPRV